MRVQSGCIPYRFKHGKLEVLMITNRKGKWAFPKGGVEGSPRASAEKECREEAGVRGKTGVLLDIIRYNKSGTAQEVLMYALLVQEKIEWEEKDKRKRKWVSAKKAMQEVKGRYVPALRKLQEITK